MSLLNDDEDSSVSLLLPTFGSPAVGSAETVSVFASAPLKVNHFFWAFPWIDTDDNMRVTFIIILSSLPFSCYQFVISACGFFLEVSCRLPSMIVNAEDFGASLYRNFDGSPVYGRNHIRMVAHKQAVAALRTSTGTRPGYRIVNQLIRLPFHCAPEFSGVDGRDGVSCKMFADGTKCATCECISSASARIHAASIQYNTAQQSDDVSYAGNYTTAPVRYNTGGVSVVSIDPRSGFPLLRSGSMMRSMLHRTGIPAEVGTDDATMNVLDEDEREWCSVDEDSVPSARHIQSGKKRVISRAKTSRNRLTTAEPSSCEKSVFEDEHEDAKQNQC
jgi:hypothetical protein